MTSTRLSRPTRTEAQAIWDAADDPRGFTRYILGHDPWAMPEYIMSAVDVPNSITAVKACHASSKTFTAAELVLWWVFRRRGIAITTAPGWTQVEKLMWTEIRKAYQSSNIALGGRLLDTEIKVAPGVYATGISTDEGIRFQGFHGSVLIVIDEAAGLRPDIYEAIEGIRASGDVRVLMLANPTLASGPFYDAFTTNRHAVQTFTIDSFDTPNFDGFTLEDLKAIPAHATDDPRLSVTVRPYLVTRKWVHEKLYQWGEGSPLWQSRVRGQFPTQSEDALISLAWIEQAQQSVGRRDEPATAGIDVAGPGDDETVLVVRHGGSIVHLAHWTKPDPRGEVLVELKRWNIEKVNVDAIGIGYYMARHIEDNGYKGKVTDVNVGEAASDKEKYANLKAELYWGLRQWFEQHDIAGVTDDLLSSQLTGIRYKHNARGQIVIESKEDARKRGVKSPDRAEALMLAFAEIQQPKFFSVK